VEIGSDVVYARIHQMGGRAGRGHQAVIPARPFLPSAEMPSDWRAAALAIVEDYIRGVA
jgi:phage gpG-like protein